MPTYDFENTETGEVEEKFMSISAKEQYLKDNPHIKQKIGAAKFVSSNKVLNKAGDGWKEVQDRIKSGLPPRLRGNIKTKWIY